MLNQGLFTSDSGEWATPIAFFKSLDSEFHFTLDAAASKENAKCPVYFTKEDDALTKDWTGRVFLNPVYGRTIGQWVKKAYDSVAGGGCRCGGDAVTGKDGHAMVVGFLHEGLASRHKVRQRPVEVRGRNGIGPVPVGSGNIRQGKPMPQDLIRPAWKQSHGFCNGGVFTPLRVWSDERAEQTYERDRRLEEVWMESERAAKNAPEYRRWLVDVRPQHLPPAPRLDRNAVLEKLDMMSLLERYGLRPRRMGKKAVALCPCHSDTHPSLSVDLDRKLVHCPVAGFGGSAYDLIMLVESCGFREAIEIADRG